MCVWLPGSYGLVRQSEADSQPIGDAIAFALDR